MWGLKFFTKVITILITLPIIYTATLKLNSVVVYILPIRSFNLYSRSEYIHQLIKYGAFFLVGLHCHPAEWFHGVTGASLWSV